MRRNSVRIAIAALAIPAALALSAAAHAASFDAVSESSIGLTAPDALLISFDEDLFFDSFAEGSGSVTGNSSIENSSIAGGSALADVSGSATLPGIAEGDADSSSSIRLENNAAQAFSAQWTFDFSLQVFATSGDDGQGDAVAEASVSLTGGGIDESFSLFADSRDIGQSSLEDAVVLALNLAPGEIITLELNAFTSGAASAVPLPAAAWMLLSGVGALVALRRRPIS